MSIDLSRLTLDELTRLTFLSRQELCQTLGNRGIANPNLVLCKPVAVLTESEAQRNILGGLVNELLHDLSQSG